MRISLGILREYMQEKYLSALVEGRVEDARDKFPDMEDDDFDKIVANQPAGSNNKYLLWSLKQADALLENDPDRQALTIVIQAVRLFDGNKQRLEKKDLNAYADTAEVEAAIEKLGGKSKSQEAKQAKSDTDVIYQDDRFLVLRPHTTEASCKYGTGTKWCIAATASRNYFNSYSSSNNKFYFVIDKKAEPNSANSKFAFAIVDPATTGGAPVQVYDATDKQVGTAPVIKHVGEKWPQIWQKIEAHLKANPVTREVEEAQKATEEHVKTLMKGEKVSKEGLEKIAKDGKMTTPVIMALIKRMQEYTGPLDYSDPRSNIVSSLANRASQLTPEGSLALIKYVASAKPAGDSYWSGRYHLETLIKNAPLSADAFRDLAQTSADDTTLSQILANPNCPIDIIETLAARLPELRSRELKKNIYRALIKRGTITSEQMGDAMRGEGSYDSMAYEVLHYPDLSANLTPALLRMVPVKSADDLKRFLALPNVPPDMAADLISTHWKQLKKPDLYELLRSVSLPTEMIERIWVDKDPHIRTALLQNPAIGVANATKFVGSRNSAYRFAVAHNTVLEPESLQTLAGDESASTRAAVATNANASVEILKTLAGDEATVVRANVASNPKTPRNILDALKKDSDDFVRKSARKTLKTLETTETYVRMMLGMHSLLTEELADDDSPNTMAPHWTEIPRGGVTTAEFIAIFLLQNNGHAIREEVEAAYQTWNPQHDTTRYSRAGRRYGRRQPVAVKAKNVWQILKHDEQYGDHSSRSTTAAGKGWWWAPAGINKGAMFRLTPPGASAALESLQTVRTKYAGRQWTAKEQPPVKKSPPAPGLGAPRPVPGAAAAPPGAPAPTPAAAGPRGPKQTYKIYGKFKGHPVSTRLKGQAYVGPQDSEFRAGEQASITPADGKLTVKKTDSDHSQTWDPIDG